MIAAILRHRNASRRRDARRSIDRKHCRPGGKLVVLIVEEVQGEAGTIEYAVYGAPGELPELPVAPEDAEGRESLRALYRVLDQLGSRRRLAFVLRHVQGLEILEVAAALEISESTTRRELTRAQQQLSALARREPALARYVDLNDSIRGAQRPRPSKT